MATKAGVGKGLKLQINTGTASAPTWTTVGEGLTCDPSPKMGTEDATSFDSTGMEYIATIADGNEVKFSANRVATDIGQMAVMAHSAVGATPGALAQFQIVAPISGSQVTNGDTWGFSAIVVEFNPAFKPDKKSVMTGTLRTSNGMTVTAGS